MNSPTKSIVQELELCSLRTQNRLSESGLPSIRSEEWRYTNLKRWNETVQSLTKGSMLPLTKPKIDTSGEVVMVSWDKINEPKSQKILDVVDELWSPDRMVSPQQDFLDDVSMAHLKNTLVFRVGAKNKDSSPNEIRLTHDSTKKLGEGQRGSQINVWVYVESGAECNLDEVITGEGFGGFLQISLKVKIGKNAKVRCRRIQDASRTTQILSQLVFELDENASLNLFCMDGGGDLVRNELQVDLRGKNCNLDCQGVYLGSQNQRIELQSKIYHHEEGSTSQQLYKGIARDSAVSIFGGKIIVSKHAQKTSAKQLNQNLMLGEKVKIYTKPELQIDADDIKCTHGATVGRLSDEQKFYLQSRGIKPEKVEAILGKAFIDSVIDTYVAAQPSDSMRSIVDRLIAKNFATTPLLFSSDGKEHV